MDPWTSAHEINGEQPPGRPALSLAATRRHIPSDHPWFTACPAPKGRPVQQARNLALNLDQRFADMFSPAIAAALRDLGQDVIAVAERGELRAMSDDGVFAWQPLNVAGNHCYAGRIIQMPICDPLVILELRTACSWEN
jgi:hypothetical protein